MSDKATVCPHCGYPMQDIEMAELSQQYQEFSRKFDIFKLSLSLISLIGGFILGLWGLSDGTDFWSVAMFAVGIVITIAGIIFFCISFFNSIWAQREMRVPQWTFIITFCIGYVMGGLYTLIL